MTTDDSMMDELAHLEYETQVDLDQIEKLLMTVEGATDCKEKDTEAKEEHFHKAQYVQYEWAVLY